MKKLLIALPVVAIRAYIGTKWLVQHRTAEAVDQLIVMASPVAAIRYDSVSSTMTGALSLTDVSVVINGYEDPLAIGSVGIKLPTFLDLLSLHEIGPGSRSAGRGDFPDSFELFADDVVIDSQHDYMAELFRQVRAAVASEHGGSVPTREEDPLGHCANRYGVSALDLDELDLDVIEFSLRLGLRQLDDEFAFDTLFDIDDFQTIAITARFQGDPSQMSRGRPPGLTGFELISEDHSAMQRSLARCEALGVDRATAKQMMVDDLLSDLEEAGFVADERLIEPLRTGIEAEHKWFRVSGNPSRPVDLNRVSLYKPSDLPALFGVELESR